MAIFDAHSIVPVIIQNEINMSIKKALFIYLLTYANLFFFMLNTLQSHYFCFSVGLFQMSAQVTSYTYAITIYELGSPYKVEYANVFYPNQHYRSITFGVSSDVSYVPLDATLYKSTEFCKRNHRLCK
jgi:hypothetical protein